MPEAATIISAVGATAGLFGSKKQKSGTGLSRNISRLLDKMAKTAFNFDIDQEINIAAEQAQRDTQRVAEISLGNVFAKFGAEGALPGLPDTARSSVLRGTLSDVSQDLQRFLAERRANRTRDLLSIQAIPVGLATAGRGAMQPRADRSGIFNSFVSSFAQLGREIFPPRGEQRTT
jgi:hypothetical protein